MKTKLFLSILFISVLFSACKKESDVEDLTIPSITASDSSILKAFIELDTSLTSIHKDTIIKSSYSYDNLMRLKIKREVEYNYNSSPNIDTSLTHTTYYFYNNADSLVSKTLTIDRGTTNVDSTLRFFQRNNSLQQTRDSSVRYQYTNTNGNYIFTTAEVSNFTYNLDSVILIHKYYTTYNSPNFFQQIYKFKQTIVGGNITKEVRRFFSTSAPPNQDSVKMTYDSKINPFVIEKIYSPVLIKPSGYDSYYQPRNNLTKMIAGTTIANYIYTYNSLGLPKTVVYTEVGGTINTAKGVFIYGN